ncbi:MAG TPA: hypothetical protein VMT52_07090 [Planctomycetota bacterium]|nr:hypothetical protein [Planctomycetota bacterium]
MLVMTLISFLADRILFSPFERFLRRRWGLAWPRAYTPHAIRGTVLPATRRVKSVESD